MASVCKKHGKLCIRWMEGGKKITDPRRWPINPEGKAAAKLALAEVKMGFLIRGRVTPGVTMSTEELGRRWLEAKKNKSSASQSLTRWTALCKEREWVSLADITEDEITEWKEEGWSIGAVRVARAILNWSQGTKCKQRISHAVLHELKPGESEGNHNELLSDEEVTAIQKTADDLDPTTGAMVHCYKTYAWRPVTVSKILVRDVNLTDMTILTLVKNPKGAPRPVLVSVDAETIRRVAPLMEGRDPAAPLFLHPKTGEPFTVAPFHAETNPEWRSASHWLRNSVGATYDMKRYAITRMWDAGISLADIKLITGHKTDSQVTKYMRSNQKRCRAAVDRLTAFAGPQTPPPAPQNPGPIRVQTRESLEMDETEEVENIGKIIRFPSARTG